MQNDPPETDSVYSVKEYAQTAEDAMYSVDVITDDSHNILAYYCKGADNLYSDNHLIPMIESEELALLAGFVSSESFQINKIEFLDEDNLLLQAPFGEPEIYEIYDEFTVFAYLNLADDDLERIITTESPVLRFTGENDETKDYMITDNEIDALRTLYTIQKSHDALYDYWLNG